MFMGMLVGKDWVLMHPSLKERASMSDVASTPAIPATGPSGIGGWLILPMPGSVITLARIVYQFAVSGRCTDAACVFSSYQRISAIGQ
jgi:hypothetical protein